MGQADWDEHVQSALLVAYDTSVEHVHGQIPLEFRVDGPAITPHEQASTYTWRTHWLDDIADAVREREAWGIVGVNDDGDVRFFDTSTESLFKCAGWATSAYMLVPKTSTKRHWRMT